MIITIIIIKALKGTILDSSSSPHWAANSLHHVHLSGKSAIVCKLNGTHWALITCNMLCAMWYNGTAQLLIKFNRVYITFYAIFILMAESERINWWRRGGNQSTRKKIPDDGLQMLHTKAQNSSPNLDLKLNPHSSTGDRLGKQTC